MKVTRIQCKERQIERTAPAEVLLLPFGEVATAKGTFTLTEESAQLILDAWAERDRDCGWDYEHNDLNPLAEKSPAAAWCKLEVRADGLWAVGLTWTDTARAHLEALEYRYFSPVIHVVDGVIVDLTNVALTNQPATHSQQPLVPLKDILLALPEVAREAFRVQVVELQRSFDEVSETLYRALNPPTLNGYRWVVAVYEDHVIYETFEEPVRRHYRVDYQMEGDEVQLGETHTEVRRTWTPVEAQAQLSAAPAVEGQVALSEAPETPPAPSSAVAEPLSETIRLRQQVSALEVDQLLTRHARKVTPALASVVRSIALADRPAAERLLEALPEVLSEVQIPVTPGAGGLGATEVEKRVWAQLGLNPKQVIEARK